MRDGSSRAARRGGGIRGVGIGEDTNAVAKVDMVVEGTPRGPLSVSQFNRFHGIVATNGSETMEVRTSGGTMVDASSDFVLFQIIGF